MTGLIGRLVVAIVYGIIAWLVCLLLGTILVSLGVPVLTQIGDFLEKFGYLIGVLVGLLTFFGNVSFPDVRTASVVVALFIAGLIVGYWIAVAVSLLTSRWFER